MAARPRRRTLRFALGTLADAVVSATLLGYWYLPEDNTPGSEGFAYIIFSGWLCVIVVALWTAVEGRLGTMLRQTLVRWILVSLICSLALELSTVWGTARSSNLGAIGVDLLISVPILLFLTIPAAAAGGAVGQVIREHASNHQASVTLGPERP